MPLEIRPNAIDQDSGPFFFPGVYIGPRPFPAAFEGLRVGTVTEPNILYVDPTTDRVGIGTNAPVEHLHVAGAGVQRIRVEDTTATEHMDIGIQATDNPGFISRFGTGGDDILIYASGDVAIGMQGNTAVGFDGAASGKLHVDQASTSAAIPVLVLDQADVSEEMIEFITTIGVGSAIEAVGAKSLTTTHFIKVTIPGELTRYIPVGTIA